MKDPVVSSLRQQVRECTACGLAETREQVVCGEGNLRSKVMVIAQAPGEFENRAGRMFIGPSGKIFRQLLVKSRISTDEIYMTNLIKCYIPKCRRPSSREIDQCSKHLEQEILLVKPKLIVPLGFHATRYILKRFRLDRPASKEYHTLFGILIQLDDQLIYPLRHPTALLFNSGKRDLMEKNYYGLRTLMNTFRNDAPLK
jgi:DNA polymerase